jgi:hypothetical protein
MAYFANGTEGSIFDEQCAVCKYGQEPCPIALAQITYNYDACNNEVATKVLNTIVDESGVCQMLKVFNKDLKTDGSIQHKLF